MSNERAGAMDFIKKNKKALGVVLLLLLGIFLLIFSSVDPSLSEGAESVDSLEEYKSRLEAELGELCSSVNGVGRCRVTVTFERGEERVYKGSTLIESKPPKVMGVTVVCKGADSDLVRAELVSMMSALFDIGSNRIAVLKLNS